MSDLGRLNSLDTMEAQLIQSKRILLADDEPSVRAAIRLMLNLDEHAVTEASDGKEALRLFQGGEFDVVITDYAMPEMMGDELAARIRSLSPSQPIIMITAHAGMVRAEGTALSCVDVLLSKPCSLTDLRQALLKVAQA